MSREVLPRVGARAYHEGMVDRALYERALQLDESARRELISALQDSLDAGEISPEVAALIDQRLAEADANPEAFVSLDEDDRELRERRRIA
ncbi:addiction module protein [Gryllotalpicola sp.]|uniref:addiction module protein n=1 Tax=Gryllotalpicola sp. TaxID=1932787 RepID=UPI002603F606|nr:addiction module protein [Gryllotalpicola sp.]